MTIIHRSTDLVQHRSTRRARRLAAVLASAALLTASPPAADAQSARPGPAGAAPPVGDVRQGPSAKLRWSVPARHARGWAAWDAKESRYDESYVHPSSWKLIVDGCSSWGNGERITEYDVSVRGVGFDFATRRRTTGCRVLFDNLPRLGRYDVGLVVRTESSARAQARERIELRDHLVVSIGDSMASGEGVPDTPGRYAYTLNPTPSTVKRAFAGDITPPEIKTVRWRDKRCHRSARAGHALAARSLEARDPHSSVTYISLACSGAEIAHLIDERYAGIQPPGDGRVKPQLDALRDLVGTDRADGGRRIDALLLSIGINDLNFSDIVIDCATELNTNSWQDASGTVWGLSNSDCVYDNIGLELDPGSTLEQSYAELEAAMRDRLDIAEVYVTDYPAEPFGDGDTRAGCGLLGLPRVGITRTEAQVIATTGRRLWWALGRAAAEQGWNYVPEMSAAFAGHEYCADDRFLVRLEESFIGQGNVDGTVHPNRAGHRRLGAILRDAIVFRPQFPHWRARLVVEGVRVDESFEDVRRRAAVEPQADDSGEPKPPPAPSDSYAFDFGLQEIPDWPVRTTRRFTFPKAEKGEWVAVPAEIGSFELDLYDAPRPPRYATMIDFLTYGPSGTVGGAHEQEQGFGEGCHERVHGTGWAIRYRIEVTEVDGSPQLRPPAESVACMDAAAPRHPEDDQ